MLKNLAVAVALALLAPSSGHAQCSLTIGAQRDPP
jgi:hypothetical protein